MSSRRLSSCTLIALGPTRECRDRYAKRMSRSVHLSNRTRSSPTANILRSSRLFSVPKPLPRPEVQSTTSTGLSRHSDSATLPHPVQQAIATPKSSLSRGDWGLKRPLPLRSTTNTSTPTFRISSIDTIEHITEFESAADHTQTLHKWQEINLPLTTEVARGGRASNLRHPGRSVFEKDIDNTDRIVDSDPAKRRWKHSGPWIAGMTEGDFETYIKREIRDKKSAFNDYLVSHIRNRTEADRRRELEAKGQKPGDSAIVSEEDIADRMKALRDGLDRVSAEEPLDSELSNLIREYLDLPPLHAGSSEKGKYDKFFQSAGEQAQVEPPTTHPSAGLSYLRSNAYLQNHPVLGPQSSHIPVQARVLQPKNVGGGGSNTARLGVAGVAVNYSRTERGKETGIDFLDPEAEGGTKIWVVPKRAHIDSRGRIQLDVDRADSVTEQVHQGKAFQKTQTPAVPMSRLGGPGRFDDVFDTQKISSPRPARPASNPASQVSGQDALSFISQLAQQSGQQSR